MTSPDSRPSSDDATLAVGDRVWWNHTADRVRYGTIKEIAIPANSWPIGIKADDDPDLIYIEANRLALIAELPDGQYNWIVDQDYHSSSRLSSTGARLLLPPSVPALFKHAQENPRKPKRDFDIGHVAHTLVLGKGAEYQVLDPAIHGRKKDGTIADSPRATATWKQAETEARQRGHVPIHIDDFQAATRMSDAIFDHPEAATILADGQPETSLYATEPATGVQLRARSDWMGGCIADVKTALTAEPDAFSRQAAKFGYHIQDAFYRYVAQLLGLEATRFVFIVVEKADPHLVSVVEWDTEATAEGDRLVRQAINTYARCQDTNTWPGYPLGIHQISLPLWAIDDELEFAL